MKILLLSLQETLPMCSIKLTLKLMTRLTQLANVAVHISQGWRGVGGSTFSVQTAGIFLLPCCVGQVELALTSLGILQNSDSSSDGTQRAFWL